MGPGGQTAKEAEDNGRSLASNREIFVMSEAVMIHVRMIVIDQEELLRQQRLS